MNLLPLAERLQEAEVGEMGDSIFVNLMPADAERGILLRNKLSGTPIDYELPGFYRTTFLLIARSRSHEDGEALIEEAIAALLINREQKVGSMRFRYCRPRTLPVVFPLSVGNLLEFAVDMDVCFDK